MTSYHCLSYRKQFIWDEDSYDMICKQIVTDELIVEIENNRKQIEFLINLLDKRQLEEFAGWLSMR